MELPVRTVCVDEQARATPRKARVTGFRPTLAQVVVRILGVLALHGFSGALVCRLAEDLPNIIFRWCLILTYASLGFCEV